MRALGGAVEYLLNAAAAECTPALLWGLTRRLEGLVWALRLIRGLWLPVSA